MNIEREATESVLNVGTIALIKTGVLTGQYDLYNRLWIHTVGSEKAFDYYIKPALKKT